MFNFFLRFSTIIVILFSSLTPALAAGEAPGETSPIYFSMPRYPEEGGILNEVYGGVDGIFRLRSGNELGEGGFANANNTGAGNIVKAVDGQTVHGEYKNNTNSCASCHQTHTAKGDKLLFRTNMWNVCTACHDGTLGEFNVLANPSNLQAKLLDVDDVNRLYSIGGGTFAGPAGAGTSVHMSTGMLKVNVAAGSNKTSDDQDSWGAVFECSSCHSPHGSYSSRLLHYNPNNVGVRTYSERGYKRENILVSEVHFNSEQRYVVSSSDEVAVNDYSERDKTPWLDNYDYQEDEDGIIREYWTNIFVNGESSFTDSEGKEQLWIKVLKLNYSEAYFTDPDGLLPNGALITMDISPATVVTFEFSGDKISGYGDSMNLSKFCASCHNDYLNLTSGQLFEKFNELYGHNIDVRIPESVEIVGGSGTINGNSAKMLNCLTCHYAHGTSRDIMLNADNQIGTENEHVVIDLQTTSLKRYLNMSVCMKCHSEVTQNQTPSE